MARKAFVRNVSRAIGNEGLERLFESFGEVHSVVIVPPADPGREYADAIVEMASDAQVQAAIDALDGREHGGQRLSVSWAEAAEESAAGRPRMYTPMNMPGDARGPEWPPSPPPPPGTGPLAGGFGDRGGEGGGEGAPRRAPLP